MGCLTRVLGSSVCSFLWKNGIVLFVKLPRSLHQSFYREGVERGRPWLRWSLDLRLCMTFRVGRTWITQLALPGTDHPKSPSMLHGTRILRYHRRNLDSRGRYHNLEPAESFADPMKEIFVVHSIPPAMSSLSMSAKERRYRRWKSIRMSSGERLVGQKVVGMEHAREQLRLPIRVGT
jgi:hypothetical protein